MLFKKLLMIKSVFCVFLSLCSVNLALGLMANDPVNTPLIRRTYFHFSLLETTKIKNNVPIKADCEIVYLI